MATPPQVFISYKSEDHEFARTLRDHLRGWGYATWLDKDNIREGHYWRDEIDAGLTASQAVVGVVTPESLESRHVLNEWYTALDTDKRLFLLILREADLRTRFSLNQIQRFDFTRDHPTALAKLRAALEGKPAAAIQRTTGSAPALSAPETSNRARMLQKVYEFWVKGVLENVLHENTAFDLGLSVAPGAVLQHRDYPPHALEGSATISRLFQDMNRELLILGAPGSGKTTLMLQLARRLIEEALSDDNQPMPVVFNLSSWAVEHKALAEWVQSELNTKYQTPKAVARRWVENEKLLLLLDGLDEVEATYRDACVDAINAFRREYRLVDMVVCSRIADYEALTTKLDLQGAVMLQPLAPQQITRYLARPELVDLRGVMEGDAVLQGFARTPFLLNTMAFAYQGLSVMNLMLPEGHDGEAERRAHLFNAYVDKRLSQAPENAPYTPRHTRHFLEWLGKQMVARRQTVFYLESLQPDWLETARGRRRNRLGVKIGIGFAYGSALGVFYGVLTMLAVALGGNLLGGVASGLAVLGGLTLGLGLVTGLPVQPSEIEVGDTLSFRWSRNDILVGVAFALVVGSLITGLATFFVPFGSGLAIGGATGAVGMLVAGIHSTERLELRSTPNRGLRMVARSAIRTGLVVAAVVGGLTLFLVSLLHSLSAAVAAALVTGFGFGIFVTINSGFRSAARHSVLRLVLAQEGHVPLNYARFLDYAARDLSLLRKVGGGYIFVHRYLLDYFAAQATDATRR